jgi:hypothetical protein
MLVGSCTSYVPQWWVCRKHCSGHRVTADLRACMLCASPVLLSRGEVRGSRSAFGASSDLRPKDTALQLASLAEVP